MATAPSVDLAEKAPSPDFVAVADALEHINPVRNVMLLLLSDLVLHKRNL